MRLRINRISLIGGEREYDFGPGLNLIEGPVATGKTTLLRFIRGLIGGSFSDFPREARQSISSVGGELTIEDDKFAIVRPFKTTVDAKVDIAGDKAALRLPFRKSSTVSELTYSRWLLRLLGLPEIDVPLSQSNPEADLSPVTINDYLMYCYLRQDEIDNNVFGHTHPFRNNKRKHVFNILYGRYSVEGAALQEERRDAIRERNRLQNQLALAEEFLQDTPLSNRAEIARQLQGPQADLQNTENQGIELSKSISLSNGTNGLAARVRAKDKEIDTLNSRLESEQSSVEQLNLLIRQLEKQSNRLTKSIVAGARLIDFDFVICPRCGADLSPDDETEVCYLCHKIPALDVSKQDLVKEQDKIERQILETFELIQEHESEASNLRKAIDLAKNERLELARDLEYKSSTFVSDAAGRIAELAGHRAEVQERIRSLQDYLVLHDRIADTSKRLAQLNETIDDLDVRIDDSYTSNSRFEERMLVLEDHFRAITMRFGAPSFADPGQSYIDRNTYLPVYQGRRFEELQSQGLKVMVNLAHALAHQLTAIELDLNLPNIILIDGISGNLGYEGLDLDRIDAIYTYLAEVSTLYGDRLQIIATDNTVPDTAKHYVRVTLSEDDKLIPLSRIIA